MVATKACAAAFAAVAVLRGQNLTGTVTFVEDTKGVVSITGKLEGLSPNAKHGFHIHEFGDVSAADCTSAGPHFNPFKKDHGAPTDKNRHVGDLGNIETDANGVAQLNFTDHQIKLHGGRRSIVGRALVVHVGQDDLGLGGQSDSKTTGHAGARAGCGVIGLANATAIAALD